MYMQHEVAAVANNKNVTMHIERISIHYENSANQQFIANIYQGFEYVVRLK